MFLSIIQIVYFRKFKYPCMKTKKLPTIILAFSAVLFFHSSFSQQYCQTREDSVTSAGEQAFNRYVIRFKAQGGHLNTDLKIIPTVIHVIYRNIADSLRMNQARIRGQIDATNKQMLRLNANAVNTRPLFLPVAANCNTIVALATKKPDRASFNGVIYHWYPDFDHNRDFRAIQAATILDPEKYLNVWVVPDGFGGAATLPWFRTETRDGFWVGAEAFGIAGADLSPWTNRGVTFTHELGHYLGVEHTFHNDGRNILGRCDLANDGSIGDFCADTPIEWDWPPGVEQCVDGIKHCADDSELVTQSENYMFYNEDSCRNMFSKDQRARMRACLYRLRSDLVSKANLVFTGINRKDLPADKPVPENNITLYPNPATDIVHIAYHELAVKDMSIKICNQMGLTLKEMHSRTAISEFNLASFPEGVYHIIITINNMPVTKYIIKTSSVVNHPF